MPFVKNTPIPMHRREVLQVRSKNLFTIDDGTWRMGNGDGDGAGGGDRDGRDGDDGHSEDTW